MNWIADLGHRLRHPEALFDKQLLDGPAPHLLFLHWVTPLAAIRLVASFVRSVANESVISGFVLGLGHFSLQLGTWLGLGILLPALAHQFGVDIHERKAFALITYASVPWWLAGAASILPEEPSIVAWWGICLQWAAACYGCYVLYRGLRAMGIQQRAQGPLASAMALSALALYGFLFLLFGIGSHILLFLLG